MPHGGIGTRSSSLRLKIKKTNGNAAQAGKVKGLTPAVETIEKKKKKTGRAGKRIQAAARFNVSVAQRRLGPNHGAGRKDN